MNKAVVDATPACTDVLKVGEPAPSIPNGCRKPDGAIATAGGWDCKGDLAGVKLRSAAGFWWFSNGAIAEGDVPSAELSRCIG